MVVLITHSELYFSCFACRLCEKVQRSFLSYKHAFDSLSGAWAIFKASAGIPMSFFLSPTTLVVCCTIAKTANESEIAELCGIANRYSLPVTWVISPENLSRATAVISDLSHQHQIALAGFPDWFEGNHSRGLLRRALSSALSIHPLLESIVVPPCTHLSHRDILVENGISTACVDSFETQLRRSRRPVPEGWPCRSLFWGLWDVQFSSRQTIGSFGSWFGRSVPHQSGALIVQNTGCFLASDSMAVCQRRLEHLCRWIEHRVNTGRIRTASLDKIPQLVLHSNGFTPTQSILKAA